MSISAQIVADSISEAGARIITYQLRYPRFIHAEFMTHRVFSRNASSSRAIPVKRALKATLEDMAMPIHWGVNQPGMQAHAELEGWKRTATRWSWKTAGFCAVQIARIMNRLGAHKQVVNRITEPFSHITVVVTSTEWENFFNLRLHPDAQPEIHELARLMDLAKKASVPRVRKTGDWHLPYVTDEEREQHGIAVAKMLSVARCARVSYLTHDGRIPNPDEDIKLYERLVVAQPAHASPAEHQASASKNTTTRSNNFVGWNQLRRSLNV